MMQLRYSYYPGAAATVDVGTFTVTVVKAEVKVVTSATDVLRRRQR